MSGSKIAAMHDTAEALLASGKGILAADEILPVVRERGQLSRGPWKLSFAFGRVLKDSALRIWEGLQSNVPEAQRVLLRRAWCNSLAQDGQYNHEMEHSSTQPREAMGSLCLRTPGQLDKTEKW